MTQREKDKTAGWIIIGCMVAVLAVGAYYARVHPANDLANIEPAAGGNVVIDDTYEPPAQSTEPPPSTEPAQPSAE